MNKPTAPRSMQKFWARIKCSDAHHLATATFAIILLLLLPLNQAEFGYASGTADLTATTVTFSHPSGSYAQAIAVQMTSENPEATIIFTTDGSPPSPENSTHYRKPLYLNATPATVAVILARVILPDGVVGRVHAASYLVGLDTTMPVISLVIDPDDLWSETDGLFVFPMRKGRNWERPVEVFFIDQDKQSGFQISAGVRLHGQSSRFRDKKSFRLYFRQEYGTRRLEYPLFPDSDVNSFNRLVIHSGGQDFPAYTSSGVLLRNALTAALSQQIDAYAPQNRPAVLFLNGRLWGIYYLRERIDADFLYDHYNINDPDIIGGFQDPVRLDPLEGNLVSWKNLLHFLETHDLQEPANYAYVQSQIDLDHYIDYSILQIYIANGDWPHNNQTKFHANVQGGRWHWIFWDTDFSFGLAPRSSIDREMIRRLLQFEEENVTRGTVLFQKLIANDEFRSRFISRAADLLNKALSPPPVLAAIDRLAAESGADIVYETRRWPGSGDWEESIAYMRDFARLRPDLVRHDIVASLNLEGTFTLAINPPVGGQGSVAVNGQLLTELPWEGVYFLDTAVHLTAIPQPGYQFAGWEPATLPQTAIISLADTTEQPIAPRFIQADLAATRPGDIRISQYGINDETTLAGVPVTGDWVELRVDRPGGVDMRGWRLTDNDTKVTTDEGSLIFSQDPAFASVRQGTLIIIVASETAVHDATFPEDDLDDRDRQMLLYVGNDHLDNSTDPWFNLGPVDNLTLLAPGATVALTDDQGVAMVSFGPANPSRFGILQDGVTSQE